MPREPRLTFTVQNVKFPFPTNFSGRPTKFNAQGGDRSFSIELEPEHAEKLAADGWNVKFPRDDDEYGNLPRIDIKVKYNEKGPRPRIVCVTSHSRFDITEDTVDLIDGMDVATADVMCNSSFYDVNGKTGISAYLKQLVLVIEETELDRKWGLNETIGHGAEEDAP